MSSSPDQQQQQQRRKSDDDDSSPAQGPGPGSEHSASASAPQPTTITTKRTRVLLSCAPCRGSKLKCDRATPCTQCLKKGKPEICAYAPRPQKHQRRPAGSMQARLRRLEGMVREFIDQPVDGGGGGQGKGGGAGEEGLAGKDGKEEVDAGGSVVRSAPERATNYVGGTHFMAILEDLEDLKNYFEDPGEDEQESIDDPYENTQGPAELLLFSKGVPRNKDEMLALLPEKAVMDRLMNRYFTSNSPSQHIIHIPTFTKQYNAFLKNPQDADLHWIAMLFMVLALGVFFSSFHAPHELQMDSPIPAMDRFRQYRGTCGWALVWGRYSQPGPFTLQAFLLYTEGEFIANRVSQMNCYLLSATLIRLMLKMGLHRDPSRLPGISAYDGEMRRRMWNLAVQIDLLVSFHLGLPCMIHGIESDTALPRNVIDSDFGEDSVDLPPARPATDYTPVTYPINKAAIARVFGLVARLAHALTVPPYAEVMRLDARMRAVWDGVPAFMHIKPMEECITEPSMLVIQRFGLASLYQKSRCVLHRRYLVDPDPRPEHEYSRRHCLEAAIALLGYQYTMSQATKPGGMLAQSGWFMASLALNDFLLADMVVALVIQNDRYTEGSGWVTQGEPLPTKEELLRILRRSYAIWQNLANSTMPEGRKAADVVRTMLGRIQTQFGTGSSEESNGSSGMNGSGVPSTATSGTDQTSSEMAGLTIDSSAGTASTEPSSLDGPSIQDLTDFGGMVRDPNLMALDGGGGMHDPASADPWGLLQMQMQNGYDWSHFDAMTRGPVDAIQPTPTPQVPQDGWLDQKTINEFSEFLASNAWNPAPSA
ncbi:Uu.00g093700.m01.CDS01 [Anthostomella pinea]|uniref:Uu.00g093700.m01.CDS01 n=1 Tax=Anthostomella pinea TaxID=933095 RepID=A0AAI8VNH4_9PEZI|nr:Uu.00g093700.m01.CDS01 [Anthostomella pinea]